MEFIKKNWLALIAILLFVIFFFFRGCGDNNGNGSDGPDTLRIETQTVYVPQPPVYIPQYVPVATGSQAPIVIPPNYQPSANYEELLKQYNELANKHLTTNTYKENIPLKDSSGKDVGNVEVPMTVSENQLKLFGPIKSNLNFPHTTTTITLADDYRRFYGGVGLNMGTQAVGINGSLLYKDKKDRIYGLEAGAMKVGTGITPYGGLKTYWPLGKKK